MTAAGFKCNQKILTIVSCPELNQTVLHGDEVKTTCYIILLLGIVLQLRSLASAFFNPYSKQQLLLASAAAL